MNAVTDRIPWRDDLAAALKQAAREHKLVIVHFFSAGRPLTQTMEEQTFSQQEVVNASKGFLAVKLDAEIHQAIFGKLAGGGGALATCVLDGIGDVVSVLPGFAASADLVVFLEQAQRGYPGLASARRRTGPGGLLDRAAAYEALASPRRAEETYRDVLARVKGGRPAAIAHERLARAMLVRGRNLEARAHLDEYRKIDTDDRFGRRDRALLTEGLLLAIERKPREAAALLEQAIARQPKSDEADHRLFAFGQVLHESADDARALTVLARVIAEYPGSRWVPAAEQQIVHIKNPEKHEH